MDLEVLDEACATVDVLEGRASNYPANPIEDWAAGVRLSSRNGRLWFNDGGKLVRAA